MPSKYPARIVCLTEETTETLYRLGEGDRVVGVSGYTVRPWEARQKPRVSAFIQAKFDAIKAGITRERTALVADLPAGLDWKQGPSRLSPIEPRSQGQGREPGPPEPLLGSGVVVIRNGGPLLPGNSREEARTGVPGRRRAGWGGSRAAALGRREAAKRSVALCLPVGRMSIRGRLRTTRCGPYRLAPLVAIAAVRAGHVYEVKSTYILQPGPASLTEGVRQLHLILATVAGLSPPDALLPEEKCDRDVHPIVGLTPCPTQ